MKFMISFFILVISTFANDSNVGFLMNQKYACIIQGAYINNELVKVMTEEEALKYPTRFYIDDDFMLHTDGKIDNMFKKYNKDTYVSDESIISLSIDNGKMHMIRMELFGKMKDIPFVHGCIETNNWTIVK